MYEKAIRNTKKKILFFLEKKFLKSQGPNMKKLKGGTSLNNGWRAKRKNPFDFVAGYILLGVPGVLTPDPVCESKTQSNTQGGKL